MLLEIVKTQKMFESYYELRRDGQYIDGSMVFIGTDPISQDQEIKAAQRINKLFQIYKASGTLIIETIIVSENITPKLTHDAQLQD